MSCFNVYSALPAQRSTLLRYVALQRWLTWPAIFSLRFYRLVSDSLFMFPCILISHRTLTQLRNELVKSSKNRDQRSSRYIHTLHSFHALHGTWTPRQGYSLNSAIGEGAIRVWNSKSLRLIQHLRKMQKNHSTKEEWWRDEVRQGQGQDTNAGVESSHFLSTFKQKRDLMISKYVRTAWIQRNFFFFLSFP